MNRYLDNILFRVKNTNNTDGTSVNYSTVCFSDLTTDEMREVIKDYSKDELIRLCILLGFRIREIGDKLDIRGV